MTPGLNTPLATGVGIRAPATDVVVKFPDTYDCEANAVASVKHLQATHSLICAVTVYFEAVHDLSIPELGLESTEVQGVPLPYNRALITSLGIEVSSPLCCILRRSRSLVQESRDPSAR